MSKQEQPAPLEFEIRLAQPGEVDRLTDLHMASFGPDNNIPALIGRKYVKATYRWLVTCKRTYTLVAVVQDKIIGLVAVADGSYARPMFIACLPEFHLSLALKPSLLFSKKLWQRMTREERYTSELGGRIAGYPGVAQMTIGAVDKESRGQCIFPALIEATKGVSRSRGSRAIRAGVYKANKSSRRAFEKMGWIETPELETTNLVFYVAYLDSTLAAELGTCVEKRT